MFGTINKMSLRTRLALLAGFAIVALLVALFVAWRLARTTETFALRQAESSVRAGARDLAREIQINPDGYLTIDQATPGSPERRRGKGPPPPHVQALFAAYSDPFLRLTAITLHRDPDLDGGFYRSSDRSLVGYAVQTQSKVKTSLDLIEAIQGVAKEADKTGAPSSRIIQVGTERVVLATYAVEGEPNLTAWAMRRLPFSSGISDWANLAALLALGLSIVAVSGLAFITVRDLRKGVAGIETGLGELTADLNRQLSTPDTAELARIATAINELAANLRTNIKRQAELERELRQSERLSALGRVVAGVAHEVRNPLSAIKLKVQLAQRSSYPPDKLNETFAVVAAEIERLDSLVRRLLDVGGQQGLEHYPVDLGELISRRVAFFSDLAAQAGVLISTDLCPQRAVIDGDENRLAQVVDNIIQNALDALPDGGRLTIHCNVVRGEDGTASVCLNFEDSGPGISEAHRDHIFEPFHTGRATGTGLGLAIARSIVEEHGGRIGFVSSPGNGASFVISLPCSLQGQSVTTED